MGRRRHSPGEPESESQQIMLSALLALVAGQPVVALVTVEPAVRDPLGRVPHLAVTYRRLVGGLRLWYPPAARRPAAPSSPSQLSR